LIIPLPKRLSDAQFEELLAIASEFNVKLQPIVGTDRTVYAIIGDERDPQLIKKIEGLTFVDRVDTIQEPFKLMSKQSNLANHLIKIGDKLMGRDFAIIAGPCAIDYRNKHFMLETAVAAKEAGADMLRGGVWKPRSSPYAFQGHKDGLDILLEAKALTGLPVNTEVMNSDQIKACLNAGVDSLQIGTRNALNYNLLQQVGELTGGTKCNVILKRSLHMGPINEFLLAAEYILSLGNPNIILCPRGTIPAIQGFRNSPDESITVLLKEKTWAPVVVDPSHSVGKSTYVPNACLAAMGYGADGLLVEVHQNPKKGLGDDPKQAITPDILQSLIQDCRKLFKHSKKYLSK
jgi:3-deoxy-7-phosphoheptulonate synthase